MRIYLDNAATTQLDNEVFKAITPYLLDFYGNPSSHHQHGREVKNAVEGARATIAGLLHASPNEIVFTSGGTEADNMAILSAVYAHHIKHVITTPFEHHAVLHTLKALQNNGEIKLSFINTDSRGNLDTGHLEELLRQNGPSLVSVMHANNEIGNLNNIELIGDLCKSRGALFHSDTVQTMGHYRHDLAKLNVDFIAASAHKFHGPKGVGFIYCRDGVQLTPLLHGGSQERKLRAGTENIHGIIGLARALEVAYQDLDAHRAHIQNLKNRMIAKLQQQIADVRFNGNSAIAGKSLYTVLNVSLPFSYASGNLLNYLDQHHISVSGGSACSTGSASHVLEAIGADTSRNNIRFSFSKFNTAHEIDYVVEKLSVLYKAMAA
ncbi:cysteine desulfurase family protein [Mucilaginibacter phyllosphaerae]|uniref:cysteine desulfurase n=1 Tax=Mucilaginibacter phyllosphaerae TaxID=1812349 RepID=A0A4Y8AK73_9SPHI|nr:cysteine desulfurase family protein [Mucilaginibacter phyllosphaerae]MBB3968046.1 cysteine desulfurase [Mucilaginibacter phyllosphaerae]TEW68931.1 cysteine desulfurase [Mucilaginibacter phyllosphaerae]GGH01578.1 cysteine desulfurase [Mucilaginibacter phyllosphaerae]